MRQRWINTRRLSETEKERDAVSQDQTHGEPYGSERKLRPRIIYRGVSPVIIMIIVMRQACLLCILLLPARPEREMNRLQKIT